MAVLAVNDSNTIHRNDLRQYYGLKRVPCDRDAIQLSSLARWSL